MGTWSLLALAVLGGRLDSMVLGGFFPFFSHLNKSVVLCPVSFGAVWCCGGVGIVDSTGFHCLSQPCPEAGFWESHGVFHAPFPLFRAHLGLLVWGCAQPGPGGLSSLYLLIASSAVGSAGDLAPCAGSQLQRSGLHFQITASS